MKNSTEVPQDTKHKAYFMILNIKTLYDPAILLWGIYLKKDENSNLKRYMHPHIHNSIIYKIWKQSKCTKDTSLKKMCLHICQFSSITQSCPTLQPHEFQQARPPCPSPTPRVH